MGGQDTFMSQPQPPVSLADRFSPGFSALPDFFMPPPPPNDAAFVLPPIPAQLRGPTSIGGPTGSAPIFGSTPPPYMPGTQKG